MPNYVVNKVPQGGTRDHEVHDRDSWRGCVPALGNQVDLGYHASCDTAVQQARAYYPTADGCYYCAPACHTS
ncbi:hypothetical protein BMH32_13455 [Leucobacter sp. OLJS4]|nr:hypothetical protein BMH26_08675 [Leucobacter sp. OLTLW20]PII93890.1 hypothetical protein BMH27_02950 [Leucobacter sp. OLAS13]PII98441.1 hypothetical protein BMH29_07785 [Leucobacter sp. OLDS2]PIJ00422.1 hypothetical protein BMH28_08870 [Leucobacter sp. OLCS4]PIJ05340.1 hypothetical protein BMH31_00680 [Leucobacter sp. OLIS6]PIJ06570.1 hypothetical protein BMH32_13455 [Leucobacter sp. OLJS4]PIJ47407.1 hypothetical protein BMH30_07160 [Leucobacter sp. OLES1]PIJ54339.1 hypothetical protein 